MSSRTAPSPTFVRNPEQLAKGRDAVKLAGQKALTLTDCAGGGRWDHDRDPCASRGVRVQGGRRRWPATTTCCRCRRIETASDEAELEEVYDTERHLLYVACTRARDQVLVTGVEPASEFLEDMRRVA